MRLSYSANDLTVFRFAPFRIAGQFHKTDILHNGVQRRQYQHDQDGGCQIAVTNEVYKITAASVLPILRKFSTKL